MRRKLALAAVAAAILIAGARTARADESVFGYVYTTDPLPKGHWEYEQWNTVRAGKAAGSYTAFDLRNEFEHGVTDNLTAAFYINSSYNHLKNVPDAEDTTTNLRDRDAFDVNGVSLELRYRVLNPYKDPIGLSVYVEPELSVRDKQEGKDEIERAIEFKLIAQKNFLEDRLVLAANATFEPEWKREDGQPQRRELAMEYTLGASYRVAPKWFAGLEGRNHREFPNQALNNQEHSAFFVGPNVHYGSKDWWATLTVLPQVAGNPRTLGVDANGSVLRDGSRFLGQHEKMEIRMKFGVNF